MTTPTRPCPLEILDLHGRIVLFRHHARRQMQIARDIAEQDGRNRSDASKQAAQVATELLIKADDAHAELLRIGGVSAE